MRQITRWETQSYKLTDCDGREYPYIRYCDVIERRRLELLGYEVEIRKNSEGRISLWVKEKGA